MSVSPITCHILDTTRGKPAAGVTCQLYYISPLLESKGEETVYDISEKASLIAMEKTDLDGRIKKWIVNPKLEPDVKQSVGITSDFNWEASKPGIYKVKFLTGKYFHDNKETNQRTFFPFVEITFEISNPPDKHYHIPLLLSNHSYTTYRGS